MMGANVVNAPTQIGTRLECSIKASGVTWLASGIVFCFILKDVNAWTAWVLWGGGVFLAGWVCVGLPVVALGDRVRRIPFAVLCAGGGLAGAFLMALPNIWVRVFERDIHWAPFTLAGLVWPGIAFPIAALTTALYRTFLDRRAGMPYDPQ